MDSLTLRKTIIPILTVILCFSLWKLPLGIDYFETIIATLFVLAGAFFECKKGLFKLLGFQKNRLTVKNILIYAPALALGLFLIYAFVLIPLITDLTGEPINFSGFNELKGNLPYAIIAVVFIWISAAFGEEIVWRGYFMRQFAKFFGESKVSILINILLFAIAFGFFHGYQGVTGQIVTGIIGMLLAIVFYLRKYDLWFNIAVHGFFDTIGLLAIYNGWT